jgi:hypothetical protein
VRQGIFDTSDLRIEFVANFAQNMIWLLQSGAKPEFLLKERLLFKEFVRIPHKFEVTTSITDTIQMNFQIRDLAKVGDAALEAYL